MYTGREYDRGLKLYYNRARYYNPQLGRFISRVPIDIADDVNLYAYVGNNSVMFVDLNGLESKSSIAKDTFDGVAVSVILDAIWMGGDAISFWSDVGNITGVSDKEANLRISSYMLRKFKNGEGSSDYYGSNHWISKRVTNSDFYSIEKDKITNYFKNNSNETNYVNFGKGDIGGSLFEYFGTSFGTVNWSLEANINGDGNINTEFHIKDTYIYNDYTSSGDQITEWPNVLAKYYQDMGYGKPFKWELRATEKYNINN